MIINHEVGQGREIIDSGGALETIAGDVTVEKTTVNPPSHLLRAERDLLLSCMVDKNFRKRGGTLDWEKVENVFANKADNEEIFFRDRKRLRSTSKKITVREIVTEVSQTTSTVTVHSTQDNEIEERNQLEPVNIDDEESVMVVRHDVVEESTSVQVNAPDSQGEIGQSSKGSSSLTHSSEPKRMIGSLSELEREFVRNYGKLCITRGKNIDNNCMLKACKKQLFLALLAMEIYSKNVGLIGKKTLKLIKILSKAYKHNFS